MDSSLDYWATQREQATVLPCGLKVLLGTTVKGLPSATIWQPKAKKPCANYCFRTEEERTKYINQKVESLEAWKNDVLQRRKERRGSNEQVDAVKVGDIFHHSWGYDQTNADFYQVVGKSGRRLTLCRISKKDVGNRQGHSMSATCVPVKDSFTREPFTALLQFQNGKPYVTINSFGWCDLWDGRPVDYSWYA